MRRALVVLAALVAVAFIPRAARSQVHDPASGHWYEIVPGPITWADAKAAAESRSYLGMRGHLATITSPAEDAFVAQNLRISDANGAWIGASQPNQGAGLLPDQGWQWVTTELWRYTNWAPGEPNDYGRPEWCLVMFQNGQWNDLYGTYAHPGGYIVEYEPVSHYRITVLASGGGYGSNAALGINARGQVVGSMRTASGATHPFFWDPATGMRDLGTFGGSFGQAWAINDAGVVAGYASDARGNNIGFHWPTPNGLGSVGVLPSGASSQMYGINNRGQISGWSHAGAVYYHTTIWQAGTLYDLGPVLSSFGAGINDYGQIVGYLDAGNGNAHAFVWTPHGANALIGDFLDLGTFGGAESHANRINATGQVAGDAETSAGALHAMLWTPDYSNWGFTGRMVDLGTLPGTDQSIGFSLNDAGVVVGRSYNGSGLLYAQDSWRAFVSTNGTMYDINDLVLDNPGLIVRTAYGINTAGQIVGEASDANRVSYAVLLTPTSAGDVSSQVHVVRGGFFKNRATGRFMQTVTLKNVGTTTIAGPISLVLDRLSRNVTLYNPTGVTSATTPAGSPYVDVSQGVLASGASISVTLQFTDPTNDEITYTTRVLAGPGSR